MMLCCPAALYYLIHLRSCAADAMGRNQNGSGVGLSLWTTGFSILLQFIGSCCKTGRAVLLPLLQPCFQIGLFSFFVCRLTFARVLAPCFKIGVTISLKLCLDIARVLQQILSLTPLEVCALTVLVEELSTTGYDVLPNMIWQPLLAACVLLLASAEWHVPKPGPSRAQG